MSLGISYPSIGDAKRGLADNLITETEHRLISDAIDRKVMPPQKTGLGGEIYIHGGGLSGDWTGGCLALNDGDVTELFHLVPNGAAVDIFP